MAGDMRLGPDVGTERLMAADHGVLATVHPDRGVDVVPVCFALHGNLLAVPIDVVKPKTTTDLQRRTNLGRDPRATLLVEGWDAMDWSQLWWVRAELRRTPVDDAARNALEELLRDKYHQYRSTSFADLLTFEVRGLDGWAASASGPPP